MTSVERVSRVKRDELSSSHYFQTLLEQGYKAELFSDLELEQIQFSCLALLAKSSELYNGGDSSSIRVELAQELLASISFTIGVQLKTISNPDDAIEALRTEGVGLIYTAGRKRVGWLIQQAKMRYSSLQNRCVKLRNIYYVTTIMEDIKSFFKLYNPEFGAHETHIMADYPVYNNSQELLGVEFIARYLEQLYFENSFCAHFPIDDISRLLSGYDHNYSEQLFNLYEPVLAAALGCCIAGVDFERPEITPEIQDLLQVQLSSKDRGQLEQILLAALSELGLKLSFSEGLMKYVKQSILQLASSIENSLRLGYFGRVFILSSI